MGKVGHLDEWRNGSAKVPFLRTSKNDGKEMNDDDAWPFRVATQIHLHQLDLIPVLSESPPLGARS